MDETRQQRRFRERKEPNWVPMGPEEPSIDKKVGTIAGSGVLALATAVLGNVMPSMGAGGLPFFYACMALAAALFAWGHWGWKTWPVLALAIIAAVILGISGYRAVTNADEILQYQVCARPLADPISGAITSLELDLDVINKNKSDKWLIIHKPSLSFAHHEGLRQLRTRSLNIGENSTYVIATGVNLDPPVVPHAGVIDGQVDFEMTYGTDEQHARRPFRISGELHVTYDGQGMRTPVYFDKDEYSSPGLTGYCNLQDDRPHERT